MNTSLSAEPLGLSGRVELQFRADAEGRTLLARQFVSAPFHLSKPYWDGRVLLVNCVNATAGVFAGDRLESNVSVERGARVLLTSPSAHRVHTMKEGRAEFVQRVAVGDGASLEVMPELFIPQRDCTYRQATTLDVAGDGELVFAETLAPGRVAHGESFAFRQVAWALDVNVNGRRVARERYVLEAGRSLWGLTSFHAEAYYAAVFVVSPKLAAAEETRQELRAIADPGFCVGVTDLAAGAGWVIKILAIDSVLLRDAMARVRKSLSGVLPLLRAEARKL